MRNQDKGETPPSLAARAEFFIISVGIIASVVLLACSLLAASEASAHPGGLAADGCHNDRKNGGRHCHRGPSAGTSTAPAQGGRVYYPNCAAARAAGAAPIYRGQPGYGSHLDRDNDGKACE